MYIDLILMIIILILVFLYFRRWSKFVYAVAMIDIFLRILAFFRDNVPVPELRTLLKKYFSSSIPDIFLRYTSGMLYTVLMWILVVIYIFFFFYILKIFLKKRR